ncbi:hypothetical protein B0H13DRAFT_2651599 [Mycena leptocephala]|nr:hypothetical protein B0H13DRAFT_2651599 [Mycena leptocephala]
MCPRLLFDYMARTKAGPAARSVFFHRDHPITSHNIPSVHVPTTAWVPFELTSRTISANSTGFWSLQNEPYKAFPMSNAGSVAGLPLEFTNNAFERGLIDFTEGTRYVFQYTFVHALPVQEWESLAWKISAKPYICGASWKEIGYV